MSRESNRPTKTNYQDYLFDFSDVDFSQGAARPAEPAAAGQTPTQERGFLERLGYSALAIGEGLPMLPGRMADTIRDAWNGGDIDVTDTEALQEREQRAREQAAYAQKYQGKAFDGVTDAMISMPYSLTTLAAGIGASVPATLAAGPVAGGAAAMAASGGVAYRASKQEFMENMLEETSRVLGRRPTQEEWDRIAADFDSEATQYGLWEAGPEALGNLFFTRLLGPLGKGFLTDGLGKAVKRGIGLYGGEMGTETATQMGQGHIAAEMGWRDEAPGPLQALKEIAPATFWQTTLMAGGKKGLDLLAQRYQERAGQKGMAAGIGGLSSPASPPPTVAPEDPETYERDAAVKDDLAASSETTTAAPGLQPSLDNGEHIDLLRDSPAPENGPSPSMPSTAGMAAGIGGLDPLRASPAADTLQETPLAARGTPEISAPPAPLPPLPGVASGIGGLPFSPAQPAPHPPAQIPTLPTQAQLTRTQEKPRADTTAAAEQLGIPGPEAVPQEAQRPELSPAMPQQTLPNEAQAPTVPSPLPAPAMQPTPLAESPQAAPQQPDSLPTSARQPETSPVLPPAEPVVIPPELAGLSRKELIRRLPRQLRGKADFMGTEEMRSLLARRLARTQATGPEQAGAQPDTAEEKTPLTYGGKPLSHPPIGDARRENTADAILAGAAERAKAEGRQEMLAAVEDMQRERKSVGVTHDALWQRITDEMLPYAGEAGQEEAARTGAAPEDAGMPPARKVQAEQRKGSGDFSDVVAHVPSNAIRKTEKLSAIAAAKAWIRKHIFAPAKTEIGDVEVDANAIQDSLSHSMYQNKLDAVQAIVPVLEKGSYLGMLPDKDGNPIENHYFAGRVRIGENEKIVFVRTRQAKGTPNRFYVHEVFTQEEIEKSGDFHRVTSDADRPYRNSPDFYRSILANYLKGKTADAPGAERPEDGISSSGQSPESEQKAERPQIRIRNLVSGKEEYLDIAESPRRNTDDEAARRTDPDRGAAASPAGAFGTIDAPDTVALAAHFSEAFLSGKKFGAIIEARREAGSLLGGTVRPATEAAKAVDEAVELGVTLAARRTVAAMRERHAGDTDIYRALVDLYQRQPRLNVRTSTSIAQQAYSTPAPIAFLASRLAGIDSGTRVFEPTAGNGMLLLEASPDRAAVNELNPDRASRLRSQGFEVTERDAVDFRPEDPVDVVIANPPFGRVKGADRQTREFSVNGLTTKELDHAIVARALESLKQGGRAVLIIGGKQGNDASRSKKYRAADQVRFWGWLFERYRVLEHFCVDGKLYERQGAGYPIDVIVLENSGTSAGRPFPGAALPRVYTSFNALEEVLHGQVVDTAERKSGSDGTDTGRTGDGANQQRGRSDRPADAAGSEADRGSVRSGGNAGADGARSGERLDSGVRDDRPATAGGSRLQRSERPAPESGNDVSADAEGGRAGGERQADVAADSQRGDAGKRGGRDDAGRLGQHRDGGDVRSELGITPPRQSNDRPRAADRPKSTVFQVAYEPASAMQGMGTLVPRNMATAARQAMTALEKRHGSIDRYVAGQLGYPEKDLGKYFAAEQVDALGMAISNIADGSGFIIGDQTGIGKGRVNAGIIRWAKRQGYIPVFVTMKPDLYADMVRDLADIGMEGFNPLPTNADLSGDKAILLPDGRTLRTKTAKAHEKVLADVMKNGMGAYDAVFTTYDQLNPVKGQDTFRRQFMMNIAPNAVFILDESHNAGGQANVRKKADAADDRAQFVRKMLQASHQGAFYSSATYAKRPDVMSLYFKTDMQYAADDMGKLAEAIERGGIPMQQAVAAELTETGQYLRRERSFEGAEVQTSTVPIDKARAEKTAEIMRAIMAFDAVKEAAVERADKEAARRGGSVGDNKSTGKGGASSTNFTAVMHNVIAQSLLAQKVDAVVEAAAGDVARGEKVVIALSNTMGSMIREFAEQNGIAAGSPINFTFNDMFIRYLEKSRMISIREAGKKEATEKRRLTDEELGPDGVRAYNQALAVINKSDFGGLPVSVIDRMLAEFEARGIRADEITGRTERIDYTTDVPTYAKRTTGPSDRIRVVDAFNAGKLDVVILNQAGSTGISLHASERFKDQRRRNMIIAQAESNIDVFMQTLGRVFRTGQVVPPTYQLIMSDLPAEKRPAAVLAKKMASLNANTTASKDSDASFKNIPDFLNKYGDKVAAQVMADNPALALKLGSPVGESSEDAMRKVTGRIPLLPVKEQEKLYALLESEYNDYIAQLEALGGSGLEARSLPLDARLTASEEIVPARDVGKKTPFADAAVLGTYDVKKLGKPWPAAKVREMVSAAEAPDMDGLRKEAEAWHRKKAGEMSAEAAEKQLERLNAAYAVISDAARMQPGTPVTISGNNTMTEGILIRLYRKGSADNPLALSAWKLDIALPDASRRITIPLSQTIRKEDSFTVSESSRNPETLYALFDSGQKESREKVHIITGNILAAFQKINGKGNVITFQDHEGRTIPGILLPRDTDPRKLIEGMDVSLSPDAAMRFLKELPGSAVIKSADKLFSISFNGRHYSVYVPSSKAKGAQFFLNGAVLQAAGKDFVKSGQNMALRELEEAQASGILRALSAQGYGFVADNNRDRARALAAGDGALASLGGRRRQQPAAAPAGQFLPPRQKSPRHTPAAFKAMQRDVAALNARASNGARAELVATQEELPARLRQALAGQTAAVEGVYDPATGVVWLIAENLASPQRAVEVWAHETLVHHGLRATFDEGERQRLLNDLWLALGGMKHPLIAETARRYGKDPRSDSAARPVIVEEALAKLAEQRGKNLLDAGEQRFWRRVVAAVLRAWHMLVRRVTGRSGSMDAAGMERLLDSLQGYVLDGRGVHKAAFLQEEGALASLADKEKSPARARIHRLQLPKVRRLPAGLSDTTIQAEDSASKPEGAADEAPLASLRSPDTSWRERVAAAVRGLRNIAGRGVSEDVQALLDNPEQGRLIPREDLGRMERLLKLPHWVAKDHPQFATIYNRQLRRVDERRSAVLAATRRAPLLFDADAGKRLNADEERQLGEMIWKWDGREPDALRDEEKFTVTGTSLNGREELELNPRYQEKFRAWLREQPEPERVKEAFAQVRALLDESFLHAYQRMSQMIDMNSGELERFRADIRHLHNYFPHQRKGKYYVEATATGPDGKRQLVYRQHFDVPLGSSVREEWAKIVAANEKDYPGATWHNPKEVVQLPDDILGAPLDPQAMEQLINTTVQRQIKDSEQAEEVRKALLSGLADVLKSRGFGAHAIQRKNIPGFDRDDIKGILYNYISGLHGWLSKMDASADFAQALGKISAQKSPELWSFASQYVKDMLRNADSIDRIAGNIKTAAFVWYLGINIKTAVVNSTQNLIVGVPRLQQEVTGGGALWLKAAMDTLGLRFSGRGIAGAKALKADELRMLEELYGAGVIADAHMDEIRGQMARSPALRMWEKIVRIMGMPMSIVEHFNRASLALAAYRAARAGRLSTSACQRLGVREGERLNHDMARDFADMLVRDTHFEYGKGNAPELLRSTTAGRMLSPAFVFRSYSGNIINLWWRALRHEGREGRIFVAKSLGATVALGGLTAFPFYATLSALCTALSGDDEDWTTKVRRRLPESNLFRDVVCYGLPSLAGVTIGGSLRMETPFTEGLEKGTTFKEIMTQSLVSLIGVPYDLAVNKVSRALEAHSYGADDRALEALVPTFMANIMQARRLATEGQTTLRGRPINSPGQQGARKLDAYEAFGKALGFQPTSSARSYAAYKADKLRSATRSDRIDDFTNLALRDLESNGHAYMLRELRKRLQTWNAEMEEEGKTAMRIMPKEVLRRVTARRRENRPSREQRAKGAAQMALWGV